MYNIPRNVLFSTVGLVYINVKNSLYTSVIDSHIENSKNRNCEFSCRAHRHNADGWSAPQLNSQFQFLLFSMCESITLVYKLFFTLIISQGKTHDRKPAHLALFWVWQSIYWYSTLSSTFPFSDLPSWSSGSCLHCSRCFCDKTSETNKLIYTFE